MGELPEVRPNEVVRALERAGVRCHQAVGQPSISRQPGFGRRTTVAIHSRDMSAPMLRAVLKQAGLSVEEFRRLL